MRSPTAAPATSDLALNAGARVSQRPIVAVSAGAAAPAHVDGQAGPRPTPTAAKTAMKTATRRATARRAHTGVSPALHPGFEAVENAFACRDPSMSVMRKWRFPLGGFPRMA